MTHIIQTYEKSVTKIDLTYESPAFGVVSTDFTRLHGAFSGIKK